VLTLAANGTLVDTGVSVSTGGSGPINVEVSPDGQMALVANLNSGTIGVLRIASDGTVSHVSTLAGLAGAQSITFLPDGHAAYVSLSSGYVAVVNIDANHVATDSGVRVAVAVSAIGYFGVDQIVAADNSRVLVHGSRLVAGVRIGVVTLIDTTTNTVIATITIPNDAASGGIAVMR
jgi:DNA-binding beta-propeller fold protein YncE